MEKTRQQMMTLLEQLQAYTPSCSRDSHAKQAMLDLVMTCATQMHERNFYVPGHFTCSAIVLNPERTHVLSNFHAKCDAWMHFGGHWECPTDTAFMTIVQELCQEVFSYPENSPYPNYADFGLTAPLGEAIFDISVGNVVRNSEALHKHFDIRYIFKLPMNARIKVSAESKDIQWMTLAQADKRWTTDDDIDVHRLLQKTKKWAGL